MPVVPSFVTYRPLQRVEPPIKPVLASDDDTSLFDTRFTKQPAIDSPDESMLSESAQQVFLGFTYVAPSVLEDMHRPVKSRSPRKSNFSPLRGEREFRDDLDLIEQMDICGQSTSPSRSISAKLRTSPSLPVKHRNQVSVA